MHFAHPLTRKTVPRLAQLVAVLHGWTQADAGFEEQGAALPVDMEAIVTKTQVRRILAFCPPGGCLSVVLRSSARSI